MNKQYPTFFLTWFNKFSQVPYPGMSHLKSQVQELLIRCDMIFKLMNIKKMNFKIRDEGYWFLRFLIESEDHMFQSFQNKDETLITKISYFELYIISI